MAIVVVSGNTVRNCLAEARRLLGIKYWQGDVLLLSNSGDNLHRATLSTGDIVEITIVSHNRVEGFIQVGA